MGCEWFLSPMDTSMISKKITFLARFFQWIFGRNPDAVKADRFPYFSEFSLKITVQEKVDVFIQAPVDYPYR
jgi:hypothetical protein